jgi:MFS superfamily sulfate permease-like transporter
VLGGKRHLHRTQEERFGADNTPGIFFFFKYIEHLLGKQSTTSAMPPVLGLLVCFSDSIVCFCWGGSGTVIITSASHIAGIIGVHHHCQLVFEIEIH